MTTMAIAATCPRCGKRSRRPSDGRTTGIGCPACGMLFDLPTRPARPAVVGTASSDEDDPGREARMAGGGLP